MSFLESYKHLDKICKDILNTDRGISSYIEEMTNLPNGAFYIKDWDKDLKALNHYRWIRNKITHEPECSEDNMCSPNDAIWLDRFYMRIINQNDPLTLYSKAMQHRKKQLKQRSKHSNKSVTVIMALLLVIIAVIFCIKFI